MITKHAVASMLGHGEGPAVRAILEVKPLAPEQVDLIFREIQLFYFRDKPIEASGTYQRS